MARTRLSDIILAPRIRQAAISGGNAVIVKNSQGTTATLYANVTGTTTMTNSQTINHVNVSSGLSGFLEPGSYAITCGGAVEQVFDTSATDELLGGGIYPSDDLLSVTNEGSPYAAYSIACTTTDGTAQFIRIVPTKEMLATSLVFYSGTAVA